MMVMMMMMMIIIIIIIIIMSTNPKNKPDITIPENGEGTRMPVDAAVSGQRNVIKKEAEEILKYEDLAIEIQRMWNVKTKVIPVTTGANGTI
jgi:hypothetical protein